MKIPRGRNSQLTRALQLIERLKGQRATLMQLSQEFGVTTRTIRRDLEAKERGTSMMPKAEPMTQDAAIRALDQLRELIAWKRDDATIPVPELRAIVKMSLSSPSGVAPIPTQDALLAKLDERIAALEKEGKDHIASWREADVDIMQRHIEGPDVECPACDDIFGQASLLSECRAALSSSRSATPTDPDEDQQDVGPILASVLQMIGMPAFRNEWFDVNGDWDFGLLRKNGFDARIAEIRSAERFVAAQSTARELADERGDQLTHIEARLGTDQELPNDRENAAHLRKRLLALPPCPVTQQICVDPECSVNCKRIVAIERGEREVERTEPSTEPPNDQIARAFIEDIERYTVGLSDWRLMRIFGYGRQLAEAELRRASSFQSEPPTWQPIETAPKDGTWIYVWLKSPFSHGAYFRWCAPTRNVEEESFEPFWQIQGDYHRYEERHMTHWMPQPDPPPLGIEAPPTAKGDLKP